jgi:hypothetical protein
MQTRWFPIILAGTLAACGGSATTAEFQAAAPTFDMLAIAQNDGDQATPVAAAPQDGVTPYVTAAPADPCHPHLFTRTHEVISRLNRHTWKHLRHVEELIRQHAVASGQTRVWENVRDGVDRKFTMTATANADGSITFTFQLEMAAVGAGSFVKVMDGTITHVGPATASASDAGAAALVENKGTVNFDFTALASVLTTEKARGQISDTFDNLHDPVKGVKRTATVTLTNFLPEEGDPHGPRNGSYTHLNEPGVGGLLTFQDSLILLCPANSTGAVADLTAVARWYKASDGAVHGRSDAKATGGQIASGDAWLGVTCAKGQTTSVPAEGYWMMKLEDATGKTVVGQASTIGSEPCDSAFGPVPSVSDNATDYDFSKPVSFPNQW